MTTLSQNTINAAKRLIKFLKTSETVAQAVNKLVFDENHVQLTYAECLPLDEIVTISGIGRLVAIDKLEALLKSAES